MKLRLALSLAALLAFSACTTQRSALVLDSTVRADEIDEVMVLPVIDARPSPFEQVQVARNVGDAMVRFLRERGYFAIAADGYNQRPAGPLDLHVASAAQLVPLSPEDAKYFLLVQVERLESSRAGSADGRLNSGEPEGVEAPEETYDARLSAVMVDRERSRVVWRDVATATSSLSGVLTVFSRGSRQYEAAVNASRALVETLPDKRVKK